ncbi:MULTISPECIES: heteromeric transposase endonuclease subunit TnsA [Methylomonas]|uniref:Transcriptional antiterminator n=2 Tax=Methylomonas TaxID=416 RepID=A0A126T4K4_9GAMM|nr:MULTISPECIES: heteromeric transposase endonuclease subunit TnsA [Methylomonas]AMK77021.1 transcriptional antiterminator [Methylomonas denitrificans]OAH98056.1 transcriptional antiterminator [Methylomonas methanica]
MGKSQQYLSETQIKRRIKEGRGQGFGKSYQPWLNVQDVPSEGRSHRLYSHKTKRIHHLLSDLELASFFVFEWLPIVTDIREQFPLNLEDTQAISMENGIKHPSIRGTAQIMSSDFLIDASSGPYRQFAVQVKSLEALADQRTIEKLELERRYWQLKQVPWFIVTENEIDPAIKQNIEWLYSAKTDHAVDSELIAQIPILLNAFTKAPNTKIIDICKQIDAAYDLTLGQTLSDVRTLTANGFIKFNIYKAFRTITGSELILCHEDGLETLLHVANQ